MRIESNKKVAKKQRLSFMSIVDLKYPTQNHREDHIQNALHFSSLRAGLIMTT